MVVAIGDARMRQTWSFARSPVENPWLRQGGSHQSGRIVARRKPSEQGAAIPLFVFVVLLVLSSCQLVRSEADPTAEVEKSPGVEHPETAGFRVITREQVDPPFPADDFTLTDQFGESINLSDFRGSIVMMTFLYTNCPEACPMVAANFVQVRRQVADTENAGDLVQILVTTDPENDTENRRKVYTQGIGGDWFFLGGELEDVASVWADYEIHREVQERNKEIVVYHSYRTYLIDREGRIRFEHVGVWYPVDYTPDVVTLLSEG
jgi:protein SCO1/2